MTRHRNWCFTINNWSPEDTARLDSLTVKYLVYGKEVAPGTGTLHLQGYVAWPSAKTFSYVVGKLPGAHVEPAKGTPNQNRDYCIKEGDFMERGDIPLSPEDGGRLEIDRWISARNAAQSGDFEEIDADIYLRCYSTIKRIAMDYMPRPQNLEGTCGIWVHGLSGCGKTRAVLGAFPDAFIKPRNTWWDGYQKEETVLIDDVDKYDRGLGGKLKHWADYCHFIGETKGGAVRIRPKRVIVTSQYKLEDIWEDEETRTALSRRFIIIEKVRDQNIILL